MKTWKRIKRIIKKLIIGDTVFLTVKLPKKSKAVSLAFLDFGRVGVGLFAYRQNRLLVTIGAIK